MVGGRVGINERLSKLAHALDEAGLPHDHIQVITGRVSIFLEMFGVENGNNELLSDNLNQEVNELVEDLAVAVACLYALEGDEWKVLAQRTGADYAFLELGKQDILEVTGYTVTSTTVASDADSGGVLEYEGDFGGRDFFD